MAFARHVQPGSPADTLLTDTSAAIAVMRHAASVTFVGGRLEYTAALHPGLNLIGVPRRGAVERAGDIAALSDSVARILYERDGKFVPIVPGASDIAVTGGQGFLVLASDHGTLEFDGEPWAGTPLTAPVRPGGETTDATPVLLLSGRCVDEATQNDINGVEVTLTNLRTHATATETTGAAAGDGQFAALFFTLDGSSARPDDVIAIQVRDSSGIYSNTRDLRYTLSAAEVRGGAVDLGPVPLSAIPARNSAPANFPNPFNPDTWIPFELADPSDVAIHIYDGRGRAVRVLRLGRRAPGVYRTQATAAHWDGRNEAGSPVSSGSYVYEIRAGSYRATRRMIVLK